MYAIAKQPHEAPPGPALQIAPGDVVQVGERAEHWTEFVHITCPAGSGWVPARYLSAATGEATVTTPYDTTELTVEAGERVEVLERDDLSEWWWCRSAAGVEGWVPVEALTPVEHS